MDLRHLRVTEVTPFPVRSGASPWTCTQCSTVFPAGDSWAVHVRAPAGSITIVVCPPCADELWPRRLEIDIERLAGRNDETTRCVAAYVGAILRRRGADCSNLVLRAPDTHAVARDCGLPVDALIDRLSDGDVLIAVH